MAGVFVRQDISTLEQQQPWHPVTMAYALAVREMRRRDAEDPASWPTPATHPAPRPVHRVRRRLPASSTTQLERAWDAWQAERYQRGEISQWSGCTDNPFRPR